jgi:hypothetical protein
MKKLILASIAAALLTAGVALGQVASGNSVYNIVNSAGATPGQSLERSWDSGAG